MTKTTLYNTSSKGKTKVWSIWVEGDEVVKEWGLEGHKTQQTRDRVQGKNIGRSNETSPKEQAIFEMERAIRLKTEEGYATTLKVTASADIDWKNAILPDCFAPSKPEVSIEPEDEAIIVNAGNAIYQRKHNGMRAFVIKGTEGTVNIYSRRLELKTDLFPKHVEAFKHILSFGTIVDCECVANDDPDLIKTIFGADSTKAIERQKKTDVDFIIFDILYHETESVAAFKYKDRYAALERFKPLILLEAINRGRKHISMISIVENIKVTDLQPSWEGLILRDSNAPMKIRWDGKPDRKSGSWKKKNFKECDVVAYKWVTGKGKNNDRPAKLFVGAYDDKGNFVNISEAGSGLTEKHKDDILDGTIKFPITIELKYEEVTPDKSFRLPIFLRFREDKPTKECLLTDIKGYYDSNN
jgi:ATP-dependent DNA ligase